MPQHAPGLGRDQLRGLHHVAPGGPPFLDRLQFLRSVLGEHVLEQLIHVRRIPDRGLGGPALVQDRQGRPVRLGLQDRVLVQVLTEDRGGVLAAAHDDRRAGEPDPRAVRQRLQQVRVQRAALRPVRLIHQHHNVLRGVQHAQRLQRRVIVLAGLRVAVLLDHREDQRLTRRRQQLLDLRHAGRRSARIPRSAPPSARADLAGRSGR